MPNGPVGWGRRGLTGFYGLRRSPDRGRVDFVVGLVRHQIFHDRHLGRVNDVELAEEGVNVDVGGAGLSFLPKLLHALPVLAFLIELMLLHTRRRSAHSGSSSISSAQAGIGAG